MNKANSQFVLKETSTVDTRDIGRANKALRVFAFASGGFDAVMQLGTIHALLITGERADIALGISAGAVNAVALGEILKIAPDAAATQFGKDMGIKREAAAIGRFLEILEAYCEVPMELLRSIRPDLHEVTTGSAFKPLELPIHFKKERDSRGESLREKSGLIRFLNGVFDSHLPFSALTRFVRLGLDYIAAGDGSQRSPRPFWILIRMWLEALRVIVTLSPSVGLSLWAISGVPSFDLGGVEAKTIIFHKHWPRLKYAIRWLLGALAILTAPLLYIVIRLKNVDNAKPLSVKVLADRFLEFFCLKAELGDSYTLEQSFVKFFDRDYYGKFSMDEALAAGLSENRNRPQNPDEPEKKKLSDFTRCDEENGLFPIHVVPVAAKLADCKLHYFPAETPVVDALMASTALVPFFRAREVKGEFYIDGANVSNEPIREAMRFLQRNYERIDERVSKIIIYSVTPFPIKGAVKAPDEGGRVKIYNRVVDIGLRASALAQLRDAELEQKLMKLYNKVLPEDKPIWQDSKGSTYVSAEPVPIATEAPLDLNERIPAARSAKERRKLIVAAVADGCRLSLEQFIAKDPTFVGHIKQKWQMNETRTISCGTVIRSLREANVQLQQVTKTNDDEDPGIAEICRACRGKRSEGASGVQLRVPESWTVVEAGKRPRSSQLSCQTATEQPSSTKTVPGSSLEKSTAETRESDKAQVALLFSGGVFRGVFQIGVANALALVLSRPQIVAGASVGSITAGLVAQLFCEKSDFDQKVQIRRLAATYLTLDRFVLTDRIADFVRRFTVRAGNANFSVRDLDLVLRRFEAVDPRKFNDCLRRVAAGLERLFYLNPFTLFTLVRDLRLGRRDRAWQQIQDCIQEMLERYGVGLEILGPEPLSLLLREHVLRRNQLPGTSGKTYADLPEIASFDFFREHGIEFLATVTNLTEGKLDVLDASGEARPRFVDGLLASSAFPALFRPRWSWEVFMTQSVPVQFSDGGMLDNLPFYPVVDFIEKRHPAGTEPPAIPHLIFTASLEPEPEIWDDQHSNEWKKAFATSWLSVRSRAKEMKFNKKIEDFVRAQREVRSIFKARCKEGIQSPPLSIDVLVVKPKWLCGTFAFHPMLGFRRDLQAANIAHGCYQTLEAVREFPHKFADGVNRLPEQKKETERALTEWGFKIGLLDNPALASRAEERKVHNEGQCWYYPNITCPFSEKTGIEVEANEQLQKPLSRIYQLCGEKKTHMAK